MRKKKYYQINEKIKAEEVRLIDQTGENVGIVPKKEALAKAEEAEMDLVIIGENAKPPVAKIMEFRYFLRQQHVDGV